MQHDYTHMWDSNRGCKILRNDHTIAICYDVLGRSGDFPHTHHTHAHHIPHAHFAYYKVSFTPSEKNSLWTHFDRDASGAIDYTEFVRDVRGEMTAARRTLCEQAFATLDKASFVYCPHPLCICGGREGAAGRMARV